MKKLRRALLLGLLSASFSAFTAVNINETASLKKFSFSVDGLKLAQKEIEGQVFQTAELLGVENYTGIQYEVGSPEIPVIRFYVDADQISDITVTTNVLKSASSITLAHELKPSLESVEKLPGARYTIAKNKNYKNLKAFPEAAFSIVPAGSIRGTKKFLVTLFPVQYMGTNNTLKIVRTFEVTVKKNGMLKSEVPAANNGLIFIVGDKFKNSPSLKQYMDVKKTQGFTVSMLAVPSKTPADQIRAKLKAFYKTNPNLGYAIIIGDADELPGKTSAINGYTDHYFSAIDSDNYDADINSPDIGVGRIAVANEAQLATVFKKYTRYIRGDFAGTAWLSQLSFLATDDRYEVAEGTHNYVIDTHTKSLGYMGAFPNSVEAGGDKLYAITHNADNKDVMTNISKGRSIIDYSGHGANTYWDAPRVSQTDVRSLNSSSSSLPFVISNACITGDYRVDESFAETWQRHEWGAIMFWGSMDNTYWDEDDILEKRMFDGIFTDKNATFTEITHHALAEMWKEYGGGGRSKYYWETYHMFGDPSITLRLR